MEIEVSLGDEYAELTQHAISDVMSPESRSFRQEPLGKEAPSPVDATLDENLDNESEEVIGDLTNEPISQMTSPEKAMELSQHLAQWHISDDVELSQHALMNEEQSGSSMWMSRPGTVIERKMGDTEQKSTIDFNGESIDVNPIVDSRMSIGNTIIHTNEAPISSSTPAVHTAEDAKSDSGRASPDSGEFHGSREEREMKEMLHALKADIEASSVSLRENTRVGSGTSNASSKESGIASRCTHAEQNAVVFNQIPADSSVASDLVQHSFSPPQHQPKRNTDLLGQKVVALLAQPPPPKDAESYVDSNNSALANSTRESEREDLELITSQYRSLLQDEAEGSGPIELNTTEESSVNVLEVKPVNIIVEETTWHSAQSEVESQTSGSDSEDGINRDVKSILMKYGHAFSDSSESDVERGGFGMARMDERSFAKKIEDLVMGPGGDMNHLANTQSFDDPAISMTLPNLADTSADSSIDKKKEAVVHESEDELGHRIQDILSHTSHLKKANSYSKPSSISSSIDFGALEKDLDEIRVELDSMKSESSQRSSSSGYQDLPEAAPGGVSDVEDVVEEANESNRPLVNLGVDPLLTSGVIPLDIALEIMHSGTYDSSGRPKVSLDCSLASQRMQNQSRVGSSINDVLETEEHLADSEVEDVVDPSRPPTALSGQSLTERVQNILERSSPPRQAYRYLEEANRQQERLMEKNDHEESLDILKGALRSLDSSCAVSPFRHMTPFNKLENMRGLFSHQVQSMKELESPSIDVFTSTRERREDFEREFEMRRLHIEHQQRILEEQMLQEAARITPTDARLREIEEPQSSPVWRELSPKTEDRQIEGATGRSHNSAGLTSLDSQRVDAFDNRQSPTLVPYKPKGGNDVYFINLGKFEGDISLDALNQISLDNSQTDPCESSPQTNSTTSPEQNISGVNGRDPRLRLQLQHQQRSSSRESSLTPPSARRPRSPASDSDYRRTSPPAVRRRSHLGDGIVLSSCEDGSVAGLSETTIESTHPGSDDARGPSFPIHILGSRPDPTGNSLGIYGTRRQSPLGPIEEQPSVGETREDISQSATRTSEDVDKSRRSELQERSFKKAETWVKGNFTPAYKEGEKTASTEGSVEDILSENSELRSEFGTPKKAERSSEVKMAHMTPGDYRSGARSLSTPVKESLVRRQREEVMRKFGYTKPMYTSQPAFESRSSEQFEPLAPEEAPHEDNFYEPARISSGQAMDTLYSSHGLQGFSTYADQPTDQSDNSVNTDELLARIRGHDLMPSSPTSFKTLSPVPLPSQESRDTFLHSTSPSLPRVKPRSPPYHQIQGPDGPANEEPLEQHFEELPVYDTEMLLPQISEEERSEDMRREEKRPPSPERNLNGKSPNVVECSPNVIQHSPAREFFRSVDSSGQDAVREIRDQEFHRLLQTAQELTGRESPELRLPRNMEAAWQRFQEQRRSLELSRERFRSMESSKNSAKDFSTERSSDEGSASEESLSQLKSTISDAEASAKSRESPEPGSSGQQQSRKMAWVIRDETLASVPEDCTLDSVTSDLTTSSEVDSDGKVITHTTRKHLPDDPKLLKLQRRVAQQRDKHRLDRHKEQHRQEKIQTMERLLRAQERALRDLQRQSDVSSSTLTGSDITDASTINETPYAEEESQTEDSERPASLQLQQVDYSRSERAPRRKQRPSSKKNKENEERKPSKESQNQRKRGEMKIIRDQNNADVYIKKANTQDFGATCPTPIAQSPVPGKRKYNTINMVSEGVQTTPQKDVPRKKSPARRSQSTSPKRPENIRMFIPEAALKKRNKSPAKKQKPKSAVSWFVPVVKKNPPLKERQNETQPKYGAWLLTADDLKSPHHSPKREYQRPSLPKRDLKGRSSLQEAFERNKKEFISASRERQKHVSIRAEERRVQELHQLQRAKLFGFVPRKQANRNAHPISEHLFKPKQRFMTRQEMKEMTQRKYKKLPEVVRAAEEKKRSEEYRLNRLRARLFQKKVQSMALKKPIPWLRA